MQYITTGVRLAKAKAALDRWRNRGGKEGTTAVMLRAEYADAAAAVADELVKQGLHEIEGD